MHNAKRDAYAVSNIVQGYVWNTEFPNPLAKMIALKLADNANDEGGDIFPATTTVAKKTGVARSAVCKWQFALEHSGLLQVVKRSPGGSKNDRTERAYDMGLLRRLAWPNAKTPPDLRLVEKTIERQAMAKDGMPKTNADGSPKMVKVAVFEVGPYAKPGDDPDADEGADGAGAPPTCDGAVEPEAGIPPVREEDGSGAPVLQEDTSPVRDMDGSGADPSARRTLPVRQEDTSRPPGGHEPFKVIPSGNPLTLSPQPPKRAKRARGARARDDLKSEGEVYELLASVPDCWLATAVLLLKPILAQRKFLAPDPGGTLAAIAEWASQFPAPILMAAVHRVLEGRHTAVTSENIVTAVRAACGDAGLPLPLDRPGADFVQAGGLTAITERGQPEAFAAWYRRHDELRQARKPNRFDHLHRFRFTREATLFPPGIHAIEGGTA